MDAPILFVGVAAAALLLAASYLFGVRRGRDAREKLREQALRQAREIELLQDEIESLSPEEARGLKAAIEGALKVLAEQTRSQGALDLSRLRKDAGEGRDLTALLDRIAEAGGFETVVLSDAEGLPLAANTGAVEVDRIAAAASRVLILADRVASGGRPAATSVMLQDEAAQTMMFRIFTAQKQRLALAVASASELRATPASLDPAVARIVEMLSAA
jgi:predicted regulator of Ras-like GTPase activity (Roadblock/LC7/MglB family)